MVRRVQDQRGQCISREQSPGQFSEELLEKVLRGVSAQNYTDTVIDSAQAFGVSPSSMSRRMVSLDVIQALTQASWPGNVREL